MNDRKEFRATRLLTRTTLGGLVGTLVYAVGVLLDMNQSWSVGAAFFVAGVTIVVQYLIEVEHRMNTNEISMQRHLRTTEEMLGKATRAGEVTELLGLIEASELPVETVAELLRNSAKLSTGAPSIARDLAMMEIARVAQMMREMTEGGMVTYDGEDRDWLLGLATNARMSIYATSLSTVDAGGTGWVDGGLWMSDLGQRYLEAQRNAVRRGVQVRRVIILDRPEIRMDASLGRVLAIHEAIGAEVRTIVPEELPNPIHSGIFDFVIFDGSLSYETQPASHPSQNNRPVVIRTTIDIRPQRVNERLERFKELWMQATPITENNRSLT